MSLQLKKWMMNILLSISLGVSTLCSAASEVSLQSSSQAVSQPVINETKVVESSALKPFTKNSLSQIMADREGQAFIMVLWSIDCPPCLKELKHFQALRARFTKANLVLISTDSSDDSHLIQKALESNQLQAIDSWIFNDSVPERLRYEIDPNWYGELPRAYFYEQDHQRSAHSGMLVYAQLHQWLEEHSSLVSSEGVNKPNGKIMKAVN